MNSFTIRKPTLPSDVLDFHESIITFASGDLHFGYGSISNMDADRLFTTKLGMEEFLDSCTVKLSDLAEKPAKLESKVEQLKTSNYTLEGKRTNTIELYLVGLNPARKQYLEDQLNQQNVTFVLLNKQRTAVFVFNNLRWTASWSFEVEGLFSATISTEFSGPTNSAFMVYKDIPDQQLM